MSFPAFHPLVQQWFRETLGEPTAAQRRGWESIRSSRHTLIAAPTGSGKTLAAFLSALDDLFRASLEGPLPDEVRVLYVSPLKALSTDIHKNLAEPRRGIRRLAERSGLDTSHITAAVRTGDTPQAERAAMLRTPPHILVTTPESLYLLLTSERSRNMLRTVRTVIVDEIHAVIGTRRGAHLALSLERLRRLCDRPLLRLGLSATQKPLEDVARFLVGGRPPEPCTIIDEGHRRAMDLGVELPRSSLDAVMAHEVWEEYYDRLEALVGSHRTTLVFVNTRRMAERLARHLSDRLGEDAVTAHHGSLSKEKRLDAETRLKTGALRALVATASLELGIDIGHVDLVCQIGSPHRIATLLQRVGRSGHTVAGMPKGRLFPVTRDDLIECAALLRAVRRGELDAIVHQQAPLDVLAQQIVAECACRDYAETELYDIMRTAAPYNGLPRADFDAVVAMAAEGFSTRRGRRSALLHRDEVNGIVRGRRGSRLLAITSGGAIPELADYRVILDPDDTFVGTLNEDFAIESMAGDVFQLGNSSWRVLQVAGGEVRVEDAKGVPPNIPFWFGEAPARSDELSQAVGELRAAADAALARTPHDAVAAVSKWLVDDTGISPDAATHAAEYLAEGRRALGVIPSRQTLVLERFFDESGGMQLVLHAPYGSRINKAWGLALRKRFCRQFNFELQAAATEDALLLSLGPQHSFPLSDVFRYLHPETTKDVLVQAFLDAPVFKTRWRWNTTVALAVPRNRGGRKVAPQLQRMLADDLMAAVFPDAAACLENIPGDRQIPDHPLVRQTIEDCLQQAMDFEGLRAVLGSIHRGDLTLIARDTPEPSVFAHEILNAKPYAFLDDAPLEERRTQAVLTRRTGEASARDVGALDPSAIERVRDEVRPEPVDPHEMHDVLMSAGFVVEEELGPAALEYARQLLLERRATPALPPGGARIWVAAERIPELRAVLPGVAVDAAAPPARAAREWTRDDALVELLRGRLMFSGPVTAADLVAPLGLGSADGESALLALEGQGVVLRGHFSPENATGRARAERSGAYRAPRVTRATGSGGSGAERRYSPGEIEYCERSLLARIHRYTLNRLRAEIEPVTIADFMRFLFAWQHLEPATRLTGLDGLREVLAGLDGFELAAGAWERTVLPARVEGYEPAMLDMLCLSGEIAWMRLSAPAPGAPPPLLVPATPIALFLREHRDAWQSEPAGEAEPALTATALRVLEMLRERGASFLPDIAGACALDADAVRQAIGALVAAGLAASDGFSGLRSLLAAAPAPGPRARRQFTGRWTAMPAAPSPRDREDALQTQAWALLRRYGVVFRRLLTREASAGPWRDLTRTYRRLEARGEIRGGRFVTGVSGEQFALPDAVERLREIRRTPSQGHLVTVGTADPANLAGIVSSGDRLRSATRNKLVYRDGIPVAVLEGDDIRHLAPLDSAAVAQVSRALSRRKTAHIV
jgi:ATP-dependent helicase Lhr and Lhr-like helicase